MSILYSSTCSPLSPYTDTFHPFSDPSNVLAYTPGSWHLYFHEAPLIPPDPMFQRLMALITTEGAWGSDICPALAMDEEALIEFPALQPLALTSVDFGMEGIVNLPAHIHSSG
jgi:hypothetical protein